MAFLEETPRSLRIYLALVGGIALLTGGAGLVGVVAAAAISFDNLLGVISLLLYGGELMYGAIRFHVLLETRPRRLEQVIYTALFFGLSAVLFDWRLGKDASALGREALITLLIPLYLLANVRRLARAAREALPKP